MHGTQQRPWDHLQGDPPPFHEDRWELYDTTSDWTQARDLAAEQPERLRRLQELFLIEATRHRVLPLDDRALAVRRNAPDRPRIESMTFHGGARRIPADGMPNVIGSSHVVSAQITVPEEGAEGVVCSQGGAFSGWSLYCHQGRPSYCMNAGGDTLYHVRANEPLAPGEHTIDFEFRYDGGGLGRGGTGTLLVDGRRVAQERIERTVAFLFVVGEDFNVGIDPLSPVTSDYAQGDNAFTGAVESVRIDLSERVDMPPDVRDRIEMAIQ